MVVLVIGATGNVGKPAVEALLAAGAKVRVLSRTKETAYKAFGDVVEIVEGDYSDIKEEEKVFHGVEKVLLITVSASHQGVIEGKIAVAAKKAGVSHLVKVSAFGIGPQHPTNSLLYWHYEAEQNIIKSGIPFTFLRPNLFIQNIPRDVAPAVSAKDTIFMASGNATISLIDVRDIADVATKVLTTAGHEGRTYDLTGPEDLTFGDVAQKISAAVGREIKYVPITDLQFHDNLIGHHIPPSFVHTLVTLYQFYRRHGASGVVGNTDILLGRPPRALDAYIKENLTLFSKK